MPTLASRFSDANALMAVTTQDLAAILLQLAKENIKEGTIDPSSFFPDPGQEDDRSTLDHSPSYPWRHIGVGPKIIAAIRWLRTELLIVSAGEPNAARFLITHLGEDFLARASKK